MSLGTDFDCAEDITDDWALAETEEIAYLQACYRRLVMAALFYDADYGLGFFRFSLEASITAGQVAAMCNRELLKDERTKAVSTTVLNSEVTVSVTPHGYTTPLTLTIDLVKGALINAS